MTIEQLSRHPLIALAAPYDFALSISFWQLSTLELCEQWADGVYRRVIVHNGRPVVLSLHQAGTVDAPAVWAALDQQPATLEETQQLAPLVRQLLGDDADLAGFYEAVAHDPVMASLTQLLRGTRPPRSPAWETLCWVVIGQQISLPFARTLKTRLVQGYADSFDVAGRTLFHFPSPERLASVAVEALLPLQFSRNKASFIVGLAQAIVEERLDLLALTDMPTAQAVPYLMQFRGIGRWTAEFTLMRALGRRDALPANDAGVRQAIAALYGQRLAEPELRVFAQRWGDWQGTAALYLFSWLKTQRLAPQAAA
ncbi:MAG: DNA-3-methyladenine glycosylase 2 family protein [Roseiflexaceae bacterium]|nr:DNA-3-methyladenine glycosylase 2 family protein [Roseiflexaceae bacterium]